MEKEGLKEQTLPTDAEAKDAIVKFMAELYEPTAAQKAQPNHAAKDFGGTGRDKVGTYVDVMPIGRPSDGLIGRDPNFLRTEPTAKERSDTHEKARQLLEKEPMFKLLPEADRKGLDRMQKAVLDGNMKELAEAMKQLKDKPERLKEFAKTIEKNLQKIGSNVSLDVTSDGKMFVYNVPGTHAVEIGPDGKSVVRPIQTNWDGSVDVLSERQVLRPSPDDLAKQISNRAVNAVRGRDISSVFDPPGRANNRFWQPSVIEDLKV